MNTHVYFSRAFCRCLREVYVRGHAEGWLVRRMVQVRSTIMLSSSSPVDVSKHVVCEPCGSKVLGGFDHRTNQVMRTLWSKLLPDP